MEDGEEMEEMEEMEESLESLEDDCDAPASDSPSELERSSRSSVMRS